MSVGTRVLRVWVTRMRQTSKGGRLRAWARPESVVWQVLIYERKQGSVAGEGKRTLRRESSMAIRAAVHVSSHVFDSPSFSLLSSIPSSSLPSRPRNPKSWRCLGRSRIAKSSRSHGICGAKKAAEISNELKGTSIFLVGMNCTMKTNLGKVLANVLKYYYFESDSVVEQATAGASAAKSFQQRDDEKFQESETEVLRQLSAMGRLVVCAGDGAVQSSTNLAFLRHGISLWIDVPLDMLADEVLRAEGSSPDLEIPPDDDHFLEMDNLATRYNELKGGYATADATVSLLKVASELGYEDLNSVSPDDMAVQALKEIERLTRFKKMLEEAARPF
ncbi:hypothetical protein KFK09_005095 [Dendrobium nobile]|uniref:Inactive shikimate kinase like 1, chloroplastic n=1 Tax=Dendrobium nobile TaxID=94219 RepID=A0A8T3BUS2_DENNO|nr:hypothetical protein KFK09_005095 [Dendrobium nobile]